MFEIKEVIGSGDLKKFVDFPYRLYRGNSYWIPPIKSDEIKQLSPDSNPSFKKCKAKFWIALQNNKCVGRIGAIINFDYIEKTNKQIGRISRVEFIDDRYVSSGLFKTAENWLKDQGMKEVHGPLGFNNLDNQGLLIEGFDYIPSVASVYHFPYYKKHFEDLGYEKENDWIEFRLTVGEIAQKKAERGAEIVKKRYGFEVLGFQSNKEMIKYLYPVFHMMNDAFRDLPYVTPFDDDMIRYIGEKYFKVLNPRFVKVILKDGQLIAFIVGVPSLSQAMKKANGKLFPFGFYHILRAMKRPEVIDLYLTGVKHEYQSAGAAVVLFAEIQKEMLKQGINQMETTGIFETNHNVISNWKNYDHIQHKRRRCFVKSL
jgi:hypothetical protein